MAAFWDRMRAGRRSSDEGAVGGINTARLGLASTLVRWLDTTPRERHDKPCTLERLDVKALVRGVFAEVTQEITIANPNSRPLSVGIGIPLPDRATVTGYALEIDGQLVDGVVVPKEEARIAFETEQRLGADPGLVEAVRGNVYRTRVYPVPARGTRTIRLRYVTSLVLGDATTATLELPMPAERVGHRTIRAEVERLGKEAPRVTGLSGTDLRMTECSWSLETEDRNLEAAGPVRIDLPALPASFALTERDEEGTVWFCASAMAPQAQAANATELSALTVLWDASGSRAAQDLSCELARVEAYAREESVRAITLVTFADRVREVLHLADASELRAHIEQLRYDGGTDLTALARTIAELDEERPEHGSAYVLVTDGLDTLSFDVLTSFGTRDILAIVSGQERDMESMRQACQGLAFSPAQAPRDARELMSTFADRGRRGVWALEGEGVSDVCDASAARGDRLVALGRLTSERASLTLAPGLAPLHLSVEDARNESLLACAWAARRVSLLAPRATENADELLRLGRRFGVVSPATSLLVLESLHQWLKYDIEPPRTLTDLHAQWERMTSGAMRHSSPESEAELHRAELEQRWQNVMIWWLSDHRKPSSSRRIASGIRGFCRECGSPLFAGDMFCPRCGNRVEHDSYDPNEAMALAAPASGEPFSPFDAVDSEPLSTFDDLFASDEAYPDAVPAPTAPLMAAEPLMASMAFAADAAESAVEAPTGAFSPGASEPNDLPAAPAMKVRVRPWMPDAPYLKALDDAAKAGSDAARDAYFAQRMQYRTTPSFFLDCAGWFMEHDDRAFGLSVLSNLAELRIEDAALLRVMAWRLREAGALEESLATLRRVLRLRGEDAQSHRDLALVLAEIAREAYAVGDEASARAHAEEAGERYRTCALTPWQRRPMAIGLFAVEEYNVLRAWAAAQSWQTAPDLPSLGERLEGVPACDLRITLAWDADETDIDIHVTEPSGEEAYFAHRHTTTGGRVSEDITDGYGPELYEIRYAQQGSYAIRAHYYASHQQTVFGPATCTLTVYSDWGRPNQTQTITTTRLDSERSMVPVGTASYGEADAPAEPAAANQADGADDAPHRVERGMVPEEVLEVLGEPAGLDERDDGQLWLWNRPGGRLLTVLFRDGQVVRMVEQMPWGEEMIIIA